MKINFLSRKVTGHYDQKQAKGRFSYYDESKTWRAREKIPVRENYLPRALKRQIQVV